MGDATFKRWLLQSHNKFVFQNNAHNNRESSLLHVGPNKKRPVTRKKFVHQGCEVQSKPRKNPEIWYWIHRFQKHSQLSWLFTTKQNKNLQWSGNWAHQHFLSHLQVQRAAGIHWWLWYMTCIRTGNIKKKSIHWKIKTLTTS